MTMAKRKRCTHCKKAPALRLKALCGVCEMVLDGDIPGGHAPSGWPMVSRAAAVHPNEIPAAMEHDQKAGVPTSYDRRGRPIFTDRGHRKRYLRSWGMHDQEGTYGD